jgi:TM2 domain-containing membrane protein YozV
MQQGFNQAGAAFGQMANDAGNAMGMSPYGAGPGPMAPAGAPGMMQPGGVSDKTWNLTLILAVVPTFFGFFGIHRFYSGHIGIGIAQFLTAGGCGIWQLIDIIMIATGKYTDKQGRPLLKQ